MEVSFIWQGQKIYEKEILKEDIIESLNDVGRSLYPIALIPIDVTVLRNVPMSAMEVVKFIVFPSLPAKDILKYSFSTISRLF